VRRNDPASRLEGARLREELQWTGKKYGRRTLEFDIGGTCEGVSPSSRRHIVNVAPSRTWKEVVVRGETVQGMYCVRVPLSESAFVTFAHSEIPCSTEAEWW
jgi:hypothetical protein